MAQFEYMEPIEQRLSWLINTCWETLSLKIGHDSIKINKEASLQLQFAYLLRHGLDFLNSKESTEQQDEIRKRERLLLNDNKLENQFNEDINAYENSMLQNIYAFCRNNQFDKAVFMCGVAHRSSIISKIEIFNKREQLELNWKVYGSYLEK